MDRFKVKTFASVGNVGPGFDCFGLCLSEPFDFYTVEAINSAASEIVDVTGVDAESVPTIPEKNCAIIAAETVFKKQGRPEKVRMSIERGIPISGGLGSSAAASVGGALAAAYAIGIQNDIDLILEAALEGEKSVAGDHLDNIAPCLLGGLTVVLQNSPPLIHKFDISNKDWTYVLVKPNVQVSTAEARDILPKQADTTDWVKYMAHASSSLIHLVQGNAELLKQSYVDHFATPHRSQLIPKYDDLKEKAYDFGSIGFSISGAGPTTIAIFAEPGKAEAYKSLVKQEQPKFKVYKTTTNNQGSTCL